MPTFSAVSWVVKSEGESLGIPLDRGILMASWGLASEFLKVNFCEIHRMEEIIHFLLRKLPAGNILLKVEPPCTVGGHTGCCSDSGKEYDGFSKS